MKKEVTINELSMKRDVNELSKKLIEAERKNELLERNLDRFDKENRLLRERVNQLCRQIYGKKSEKKLLEEESIQRTLFEIKEESSIENKETKIAEEKVIVSEHIRQKRGRKGLPAELPRVNRIHDIPEEAKQCGCGCKKVQIGSEESETLEYRPAHLQVVHHIRLKYACKNCEGLEKKEGEATITIAELPEQLLPKSYAGTTLLSHVLISKFCDSLPFYRQEGIFERIGLPISRGTMSTWALKISEKLEPVMKLIYREILSGGVINIDETTIQVLHEPDRKSTEKSYMWVFRGGGTEKPSILFRYARSRSGRIAEEFLEKYQGYVQTDGFSGYNFLDVQEGVKHIGCWAHVRRKFFEVVQSSTHTGHQGLANDALAQIRELYKIEKEADLKGLDDNRVYIERQNRSKPLLEIFDKWIKEHGYKAPPSGLLGKAFKYITSQWHRLIVYVEDGRLRMDNNMAENTIRPFVVGRKNWLFSNKPEGAKATANFYSLIETVKANGLDAYKYFCYLFDLLPFASSDEDYEKLLPYKLTPDFLNDYYSKNFNW